MQKAYRFAANFLADPDLWCLECDILVYTTSIQAGVSIRKHFVHLAPMLYKGIGTFDDGLQLIMRLRDRPGVRCLIIMFVRGG